ncbi:cucumisin-like [Abrus precatorius]|uniref:Cucumisin-like n=1 Tax=Abrus precatorius TaxID=3816 RepID=A0A8B8JLJ1_ABRPR|nr:cucumisin-like [Abrus precatorius]
MFSIRLILLSTLSWILIINQTYSKNDRKTYIVYMGDHPEGMDPASLPSLHMTMAQKVLGSDFKPEAILHSYKKSFNGFVVKLTEAEAERMAEMDKVVSVFQNKKNRLRTTRSWDFIGVSKEAKRSSMESDIIVGVIDTGVWPDSKSFSDQGFGPPPKKWKGSCHNFTCNNKIIGAKYFSMDVDEYDKADIVSPKDADGHGSHTASTAAGNWVDSASLFGFAAGTARGGVPSARIAIYKTCWKSGCGNADTLAAFDDAIADGVDVISISTGPNEIHRYFDHPIDIGSFHAMKRGILTSHAAGNDGPSASSMTNYSPWLLSVAASTIGRKFLTKVQLGNGMVFEGVSFNTFDLKNKMFPLVYAGDVPNTAAGYNSSISRFCFDKSVVKSSVKGKIVICDGFRNAEDVGFLSGAAGMLVGSTGNKDIPPILAIPLSWLSQKNINSVFSYYSASRSNSTATIFRSAEINDPVAPYITAFSSRGPNPITPNTLKPDLAAPGSNILAAYSPRNPLSEFKGDKRGVLYNVISGTSMACPHASGAAAYVKSFHRNWSPAMIKSALMTTATPMSPSLNPDFELAYGAGQMNPVKAANPGLVYDISEADYIKFLCGEGLTDKQLRTLTKDHSTCSKHAKKEAVYDLNLPSFALHINVSSFSRVFHRSVTNVGSETSSYQAKVVSPSLLDIQVKPSVLSFTSIGQKKAFSVIIEGSINVDILSASLVWDDGTFQVRSPIVVYGDSQ